MTNISICSVYLYWSNDLRDLHSFPTRRSSDDGEARRVGEVRLAGLAVVVAAADAAAVGRADDHGDLVLAAAAVADLRGLRHQLVEAGEDEVLELDLRDRAQAVRRHADGGADDERLVERRVEHARIAVLRPEAVGGAEDAAVLADVLAEDDDVAVAAHGLVEGVRDGLDQGQVGHV